MALELVLGLTPVFLDSISLEAQDAHQVLLSFKINFVSTLCLSPLGFLCCKIILRGLMIICGLLTAIPESLLCYCRVLELSFLYSAAALPLFSVFTDDGDPKKSFPVCPAGESVEHFKQLLFCHLYRTQQWCNCCNFHFHWLRGSECLPRRDSACL